MRGGIKPIGAVVAEIGRERVMAERMDLKGIVERVDKQTQERKTFYVKIGVAWPTKDGSGWLLKFDALPKGDVLMSPPKEQQP